jgi:hypothetical protein
LTAVIAPRNERTSSAQAVSILLGPLGTGVLLVGAWLAPIEWSTLVVFATLGTVFFGVVVITHHSHGFRMLRRASVVAALVMYSVVVFTVAYGAAALEQPGSIKTNDGALPSRLGVLALVSTSLGIAGGEVGTEVSHAARVIAHIQLLLVIGAVAGVGGQVVERLADREEPDPERPADDHEPDSDPIRDLYRRVYARLTPGGGLWVLDELPDEPEGGRVTAAARLRSLPHPSVATADDARTVFERIVAGDLEFSWRVHFDGKRLGEVVKPYTRFA